MFNKICEAIDRLRTEVGVMQRTVGYAVEVFKESTEGTGDDARLSALEGRIESILGIVEAGIIKSDSLKAASLAADDRARNHMKRAEKYAELVAGEDADPFEIAARAFNGAVPAADGDAKARPGEGMPDVSAGMESRRERLEAVRAAKHRR